MIVATAQRRIGGWFIMAAVAPAIVGCETTPSAPDGAPPGPAPSYRDIAEAQNRRVEFLQRTTAYGVIELRWEDDRGVHAEPQVDVEMWLDLPQRTLVRIDKLGEDYFWIGSDEDRYWSVDLTDKSDRIAVIRDRNDPEAWREFSVFGIEPDSLLDLMALRPLPLEPSDPPPTVTFDRTEQGWRVDGLGSAGRRSMVFNPGDLTPRRVEIRDDTGQPVVYSELSRYESVSREGVSVLALPKAPTWIHVYDVPGRGFTKIHLADMTSDVDDQRLERLFDLPRLLEHLRPDRIDDTSQAAAFDAGGG